MKYILAADDEPINRLILEEALGYDYEVLCVENGLECLQQIKQRMPDLLLLDVAMPEMGGLEVCEKLRADEKTQNLPIVMLSGYASGEHIKKGLQAGANEYIGKPFDPDELMGIVKRLA